MAKEKPTKKAGEVAPKRPARASSRKIETASSKKTTEKATSIPPYYYHPDLI